MGDRFAGPAEGPVNFPALFYDCYPAFLGFFRKRIPNWETSEDLCQQTFLNILRYGHTFDPNKGEFLAWAYAIARNVLARHLSEICFPDRESLHA